MAKQTKNTKKPAEEKRVLELALISIRVVKVDELTDFEGVLIGCGNEVSVGKFLNDFLRNKRKSLKAEKKFEFVLPRI